MISHGTVPGIWLEAGLALLVVGIVAAQPPLIFATALLVATYGIAWLWNRVSAERIEYERFFSQTRVVAGDSVEIGLRLTNRKPVPLSWVQVRDLVPDAVELIGAEPVPSLQPGYLELEHLTPLGWYERVTWRYPLRCPRRGYLKFGPAEVETGDGFGFWVSGRRVGGQTFLTVLPRVRPLEELGFPTAQPLGPLRGSRRLFDDYTRTAGIRPYQAGDSLRRVHWPASAHSGGLQVRVPEPSTDRRLHVLLNVQTLPRPWQGYDPDLLESCVDVAAAVAGRAAEEHVAFGLAANVSLPGVKEPIRLPPSSDPEHLTRVLEALAMVGPFTTAHFETVVAEEARRLGWGATLVVVTGVVEDSLRALLADLRKPGRSVVLVSLDRYPTEEIPGVLVRELGVPSPFRHFAFSPQGSP